MIELLDTLIRSARLRGDIRAYRRVPPTGCEIEMALVADTTAIVDDTDWMALYTEEAG